jgi:Ca2+-binding EF-hand superfamily protein
MQFREMDVDQTGEISYSKFMQYATLLIRSSSHDSLLTW